MVGRSDAETLLPTKAFQQGQCGWGQNKGASLETSGDIGSTLRSNLKALAS